MIAGLKPYPAMKESGVPWLGEVPAHWEVKPYRALFEEVKDQNYPDEPLLSVTISRGVIRQSDLLSDTSKKDSSNLDKSKYKLVRPGDIAYNKMRAWQGAVGLSQYRGIISPAYIVQRPRAGVLAEFMHYFLRTPGFAKEAERWSYGITSDMWSLRPEHFKMIYGCLPALPEQATIVRYLDHVDRRVRRYIRAKQKLLKLLEEQKQAIIHRAVTRGLNPNVRLKPSGVEWLGDVPEHWQKLAIRHTATKTRWAIVNGPFGSDLLTSELRTTGVPVVYIRDISSGTYKRVNTVCVSPAKAAALNFCKVEPGDVLVAKVGNPPGTATTYPTGSPNAIVTQDVVRIRPDKTRVFPDYLSIFLNSRAGRSVVGPVVVESTRGRFSLPDFKGLRILLPPPNEQVRICNEVTESTRLIRLAATRAAREIELLREYRTRLIADVVTGKLDVREAAANLPDEVPETPEYTELPEMGEQDVADSDLNAESLEAAAE